jgi:uncharacterized protein (TIGR03545 family)
VGAYFFRNTIITKLGEKHLSIANGALVEIEGFNNKLFSLDIYIEKINIGDKDDEYKNIAEIKGINFNPKFKELLAGKFIVDKMTVEEARIETIRQTSCKLPENWIAKSDKKESKLLDDLKNYLEKKVKEEKEKIVILNLEGDDSKEKLNEILQILDLNLKDEYEKSYAEIEAKIGYLKDRVEDEKYKNELKSIDIRIKNLDYDFKKIEKIKNIEDFERERKILKDKGKEAEDIVRDAKKIIAMIEEDKSILKKELKEIDEIKNSFINTAKEDYAKIKKSSELDGETILELSFALLGEDVTKHLIYTVAVVDKLMKIFEKDNDDVSKEKFEIEEDKMPHLPKFWIKKIDINIIKKDKIYKGMIRDISSDQSKTGKTTSANFVHDKDASFDLVYDNLKGENKIEAVFFMNGLKLKDKNIRSDNIDLNGKFVINSGKIKGSLEADLQNMKINSKEIMKKEKYAKILDRVVGGTKETVLYINLDFGQGVKSISIKSDLDKEFSKSIKRMLEEELEKFRKEVEKKGKEKLGKYVDKLVEDIKIKSQEIGIVLDDEDLKVLMEIKDLEDISSSDELLDKMRKELEEKMKKELEKEIEKKTKKELDKLEENLKDWFKL